MPWFHPSFRRIPDVLDEAKWGLQWIHKMAPGPGLLLPRLQDHGVHVQSIGKIYDLYAGTGIHDSTVSKSNAEGMARFAALQAEHAPSVEHAQEHSVTGHPQRLHQRLSGPLQELERGDQRRQGTGPQ